MPQRFATYFAPSTSSLLWDRACVWLGRDPATGQSIDGTVAGIDRNHLLNVTQSAGRYGFHATIKPPMSLASGYVPEDLHAAIEAIAIDLRPIALGRLSIVDLDGFLALVPALETPELIDFAAQVVEALEPFRAPLSPRERAARAAGGLTPRQEELLDGYGYPYLFDEFRFHMTLTDRLEPPDRESLRQAAETWFGPVLDQDVILDRLCLFHEKENQLPLTRIADFPLGA